ncbi:TMEM175 family protein [soil metagenome]
MTKGRLEAFSDAVIAIVMTIMVLELRPPQGHTLVALSQLGPVFLCYLLSFVYLAIYWNNHHHMLQVAKHVNGAVLWANMFLLFALSLVPFVTAWLGEGSLSALPVALYGIVLLVSGLAYTVLSITLVKANGQDSEFAQKLGSDAKGKLSILFYSVAIATAFFAPIFSCVIYGLVAVMWFVPDRRFEPAK